MVNPGNRRRDYHVPRSMMLTYVYGALTIGPQVLFILNQTPQTVMSCRKQPQGRYFPYPIGASSSSATSCSFHGPGPCGEKIILSWPFPKSITVSPGPAIPNALRNKYLKLCSLQKYCRKSMFSLNMPFGLFNSKKAALSLSCAPSCSHRTILHGTSS